MNKEKEKNNKLFIGVVWINNCAAELKLLLTSLLVLSSLYLLLQFIPSNFSLSTTDPRLCLTKEMQQGMQEPLALGQKQGMQQSLGLSLGVGRDAEHIVKNEEVVKGGVVKRGFNAYGNAAYSFIQMGAYRGGINTFAIIGLSSKPLQVYGKPKYICEWVGKSKGGGVEVSVNTTGYKILPDWGYGRVYTVVVVNCTFSEPVGVDGDGGKLVLYASNGGDRGGDREEVVERIVALEEGAKSYNPLLFKAAPKYEYLYCGSSLYGGLNPQRVREWIAYHVRLFGGKSHFVIHDAGGVHEGVYEVLKPWIEKGYVTLQDIREQERFDGYYHNQFLVVNDCLHRYRFMTKWMFFFDIDEFIYVPPKMNVRSVLESLSEFSQFTIEQRPMSNKLCLNEDYGKTFRKWGFEKLVYRDVKKGIRRDRKYAVQPRNVFATGVHMSQNLAGKTQHKADGRIKYFHYHGTIAEHRESCQQFTNVTDITYEGTPYVLDTTLRSVAGQVKRFELKTIGTVLQNTKQ